MNMIVMVFPHIMYGLPIDEKESMFANHFQETQKLNDEVLADINVENSEAIDSIEKKELPILFSADYIEKIELAINNIVKNTKHIFKKIEITNYSHPVSS
jgi:hypothetical protein